MRIGLTIAAMATLMCAGAAQASAPGGNSLSAANAPTGYHTMALDTASLRGDFSRTFQLADSDDPPGQKGDCDDKKNGCPPPKCDPKDQSCPPPNCTKHPDMDDMKKCPPNCKKDPDMSDTKKCPKKCDGDMDKDDKKCPVSK